nr:hypothetical protein [Tanacetum cinerariifolium]
GHQSVGWRRRQAVGRGIAARPLPSPLLGVAGEGGQCDRAGAGGSGAEPGPARAESARRCPGAAPGLFAGDADRADPACFL